MASTSQNRRNASQAAPAPAPAPASQAAPAPAPAADFLAMLQAEASDWQKPEHQKGVSIGAPKVEINWHPEILSLREKLNPVFILPVRPFGTRGCSVPFCKEPKKARVTLETMLNGPIPTAPEKGSDSAHLLTQIINGRLGNVPLPASMANGEGLHLSYILAIFAGKHTLYSKTNYFQSLDSLVNRLACLSHRYCYFQPKDQCLYLLSDPFSIDR